MNYAQKVIKHIRSGTLRDIVRETRWIYFYARRYWGRILLYIFLGLAATGSGLASTLISRSLINLVVSGARDGAAIRAAAPLAGIFLALALFKVGLTAASSRISAYIGLRVNREIRGDIFRKFLDTDWPSISGFHSGDLLNRLSSDVGTVAASVLGWIPSLVTGLVQFLGALGVILYFDPVMAGLALVSIPVSGVVFGSLTPRMRRYNKDVLDAGSELTAFYTDSLQNIQSVKAFGLVDRFCGRLDRLQGKHMDLSLRQNALSVKVQAVMSLMGMAISYLCLGWGVYRLWSGRIDFGTMVLFIQLAGLLFSSGNGLLQLGPRVINATVAAKRIMAVLELPREAAESGPELDAMSREGHVTVSMEGVSVDYGRGPVLEDVSFRAEPGEVVALVGPSGAGKTTMLRLLLSLLTPRQGAALVRGKDGAEHPLCPGARKLFSYVPQEKALFSGTVAETLRMVKPDAAEEEMWRALRLAELEEVVRALPRGLDSPIGEDGGGLSEGQGQRLSIARALLFGGPVLLLDEATSALDVATERRILRNIMNSCRDKTCIVTTHRPTVLSMCSRVYQIRDRHMKLLDETEVQALTREF